MARVKLGGPSRFFLSVPGPDGLSCVDPYPLDEGDIEIPAGLGLRGDTAVVLEVVRPVDLGVFGLYLAFQDQFEGDFLDLAMEDEPVGPVQLALHAQALVDLNNVRVLLSVLRRDVLAHGGRVRDRVRERRNARERRRLAEVGHPRHNAFACFVVRCC